MGGDNTEKITIMVLKVDLECSSCCKKVKKVLCKFPQIRDQVYNEKANTITIKVLCCNPERIRDKLCCKGGGVIKSIEIKEPPKPEPPKPSPPPPKPKPSPEPKPPGKIEPIYTADPPGKIEPIAADTSIDTTGPKDESRLRSLSYHNWYRRPVQPGPAAPCYDYSYGYGPAPGQYTFPKSCCVDKCEYFSEENASGCSIM